MNDDTLRETIGNKTPAYDGKLLHVQVWNVTLPNGEKATREVALHNGASAIVPVDGEGNVYMVRQYRTPLQRILLEIPAGKLDFPGEDRLSAAKRELGEETGFSAEAWTHLTDIATTPGFCTEIISIYLARGLTKGDTNFDDDEFLDLVKMPFEEAVRMAYAGEIEDVKTVIGLLLAHHKLHAEE